MCFNYFCFHLAENILSSYLFTIIFILNIVYESTKLIFILKVMIVRSLSLSKEKARIIEDAFNMTSTKQKDVERYFGQNYYVPPDH